MPYHSARHSGDLSPEAAAVIAAEVASHRRRSRVSRRGVLLGAAAAGVVAAGGRGVAALRRPEQAVPVAETCHTTDRSTAESSLFFANWPQYLDVDGDNEARHPTLDAFVAQTGIKVIYQEEINDNLEFLDQIEQPLAACQPTGRDLIVLTDWAAARLIRQRQVQQLDFARMPNVEANLLPNLRLRSWDPTGSYAVPWQSGLTGIAYNGRVAKEVRTVEELLTRPDLKGRVTILAEMADTMGLLLQALGYNSNNFTEAHFDQALQLLRRAIARGQIAAVTGNEYSAQLGKGQIAACMAWSGDVVQLRFSNESIRFVAPESGTMLFSDNLLVPVKAGHKGHAERLINYYYDPAVAAEVAAYVNYICPVAGAHAELEKKDPAMAANPLIFPDAELLSRTRLFMGLSAEESIRYQGKFRSVIAALAK